MISKEQFDKAQDILAERSFTRGEAREFAYRGLIRCGACGATITAENKTKKTKAGNTHHYVYYHCTRRINPKCPEKAIREEALEAQIALVLKTITIPPQFHTWALNQLKKLHKEEEATRNTILESQNDQLEQCVKKINRLLDMRVQEEITVDEYQSKKEDLTREKKRMEELIQDTQKRVDTWVERVEEFYDFAKTAYDSFKNGDIATKRDILSYLGSNLLLSDKKLVFKPNSAFSQLSNVAPEVQKVHDRFEPPSGQLDQGFFDDLYDQHDNWGPSRDYVRTSFLPLHGYSDSLYITH